MRKVVVLVFLHSDDDEVGVCSRSHTILVYNVLHTRERKWKRRERTKGQSEAVEYVIVGMALV